MNLHVFYLGCACLGFAAGMVFCGYEDSAAGFGLLGFLFVVGANL